MTADLPLHPAIVHLPIALALLMPLLAGAALLAWWRGWLPGRRSWAVVIALQALLLGAGFLALRTGEREEERVEAVVSEGILEAHEEAAQAFVGGVAAVLLLALAAGLLPREDTRRIVAGLTFAGTFMVLALGYQVGRAGGEMVYRHGAAAAYSAGGTAAGASATAGGERDEAASAAGGEQEDDD